MELTLKERKLILASLDHMEEHLFIAHEAGDITLDTFKLRMEVWETAYKKMW